MLNRQSPRPLLAARAAALFSAGLLLAAAPLAAQRDLASAELRTSHVAGTVHMIEGPGGNIGVSAGEDGLLMVDDKFAPLADKIRTALAGLGSGELKFLLNTHYHGDHTGGNAAFGRDAAILAHANVRLRLLQGAGDAPQPEAWPVITFEQGLTLHFNGEAIRAVHYPHSHTDGDAAVFFESSNVVHMGDLFFNGRFPYVDLDAGGDVEGLTRHIGLILDRLPADARIIPGHGPVAAPEDLRAYHRMLTETAAAARRHIEAGADLEALKAAGLPGWEEWGSGFISTDRWLQTLHRSLTN